jgi:hypothetical protein
VASNAAPKKTTPTEAIRKVARSAKSGKFVTRDFAKKHPSTTEVETVKVEKPRKKN